MKNDLGILLLSVFGTNEMTLGKSYDNNVP